MGNKLEFIEGNKLEFIEYGYRYDQIFYGKIVWKVYINDIFHGFVVVKMKDNPDHHDYITNIYQPMNREQRNAVKHEDVPPRNIFSHYEVSAAHALLTGNRLHTNVKNDIELIEFFLKENRK